MIMKLEPLYPYAGGKSRVIRHISKYLKYADTYVEPFFGGGGVFCHMFNLGLAKHFVINDIRTDLMGIYQAILKNHVQLCDEVAELCERYSALNHGQRETMFYEIRDDIRNNYNPSKFLFVSMCDFGGLAKRDSDGIYAGYSGHTKYKLNHKLSFNRENVALWKHALERTTLYCGDFQNIPISFDDALMFCDPPYHASKVSYGSFSKNDQLRCFRWCLECAQNRNISVLFSNRDEGRFFSKMITGSAVDVLRYSAHYSAAVKNVKHEETLFVWNRKGC